VTDTIETLVQAYRLVEWRNGEPFKTEIIGERWAPAGATRDATDPTICFTPLSTSRAAELAATGTPTIRKAS